MQFSLKMNIYQAHEENGQKVPKDIATLKKAVELES